MDLTIWELSPFPFLPTSWGTERGDPCPNRVARHPFTEGKWALVRTENKMLWRQLSRSLYHHC